MINWAYIAGFFDGEGNVGVASNHVYGSSPHVSVCQAGDIGKRVLEDIGSFLAKEGFKVGRLNKYGPYPPSTMPMYKLTIGNRKDATYFLEHVMPYIVTKKLEAQDTLRHLKLFPALPRGGKLSWESRIRNQGAKWTT